MQSTKVTEVRCLGLGGPAHPDCAYLVIVREDGTSEKFALTLAMLEICCLDFPRIRHEVARLEEERGKKKK